jgi:hypothetical protein
VSARLEGSGPLSAGSRVEVTRRMGPREQPTMNEMAELNPPKSWAVRGLDGPIRGNAEGTVEPLGDGDRSRVTIALELEGHGIGKLLLPLLVRRQVQAEMPRNMAKLKERLEA